MRRRVVARVRRCVGGADARQAAVRPPKLQYQITTLPNGLRVILSEDHSTPIVHVSALVPRRFEERASRDAPGLRISSST